jgi:two-component system, NarL family, nitrate/nitrite response regulator NarL
MKVLLCDDHRLMLDCLAAVFEERGDTVELASTPEQAAALLAADGADVCVLDLGFPTAGGAEGVRLVREAAPATPVVIFSGTLDPSELDDARAAGAHGYVSKDHSVYSLVEAVDRVATGDASTTGAWESPGASPSKADQTNHFLTPRERQALEGLVQGKNTTQLAHWMGVRESTVSTHVQTVLAKLGAHSRLEAVALAMSNRLVSLR